MNLNIKKSKYNINNLYFIKKIIMISLLFSIYNFINEKDLDEKIYSQKDYK